MLGPVCRPSAQRRHSCPALVPKLDCQPEGGAGGLRTMKTNVPRTRALGRLALCSEPASGARQCSIFVPRDRNVALARAPTTRATGWKSRQLRQPRREPCEPATVALRGEKNKKDRTPISTREPSIFGAEHRIRTGDLRLGKATRPCRHPSPFLTNRHQPSETIQAAWNPWKRCFTNHPHRCPTVVFHRCSKTALGRSTSPRSRCSWVGPKTRSAQPAANEEKSNTGATI